MHYIYNVYIMYNVICINVFFLMFILYKTRLYRVLVVACGIFSCGMKFLVAASGI